MSIRKSVSLLFLFTTVFLVLFSCVEDFDPPFIEQLLSGEAPSLKKVETIHKEDKLYSYLELVSKNDEEGLAEVGCIEFIYPFVVFQYDQEEKLVDRVSVIGNESFVDLLNDLQDGYSIGLSYPISGNLKDGTPVNVNTNEELHNSLETCIEEELEIILGACNSIVEKCIWKVTESDSDESAYIDSFFSLNDDGSTILSTPKTDPQEDEFDVTLGTWIFYFIGADLHLNINFGPIIEGEASEVVKSDWNFDWKVISIKDEKIEIEKTIIQTNGEGAEEITTEKITLQKECGDKDENTSCEAFIDSQADAQAACCISGKTFVKAGATEIYTYNASNEPQTFTWQVISGDIEIIEGENSAQVTFKFGDDFTSGVIEASGMGELYGCGVQETVVKTN